MPTVATKAKKGTTVEVVKYPDPRLLTESTIVEDMEEAREIAAKLRAMSDNQKWGFVAGFAAPQIGINKRVFLALGETFINPEIVWHPRIPRKPFAEGCYSLDENRFDYIVYRWPSLKVRWTDETGTVQTRRLYGLKAEVFQHELEHLNGVLANKSETEA